MDRMRNWALGLIVILNVIALIDSFGESYAGLYRWAFEHTIVGFWAGTWPLMIDTMILAGEAGLFVAHHDRWRTRDKIWMWAGTLAALGVSVAANVGHVASTDWLSHLTAALPPVALAFVTTVGFGVMKRVHGNKSTAEPLLTETFEPVPARRTEMVPIRTERVAEASQVDLDETPENPGEKTQLDLPAITADAFTLPPDPRRGLSVEQIRVRDIMDANPGVTVNSVSKTVGIAWATAKKYMEESREARGL